MVLIDTVYQRVLALANKEQRGYITPQEFNLFADQAQHEIIEQYFYDINQYSRMPGNESEYSDLVDLVNEKLSILKRMDTNITVTSGIIQLQTATNNVYKIGSIYRNNIEVQEVQQNELNELRRSPLTRPTGLNPMYVMENTDATTGGGPRIFPGWIPRVDMTYITLPPRPRWGYVVVQDKALYDPTPTKTVNFGLHVAEETELVYKILKFAGVAIQRQDIVQAGAQLESQQISQEKQ